MDTSTSSTGAAAGEPPATVPQRSNAKPFTAIYHNNFLHGRPEKETFAILIDILRVKQEDMYLDGNIMPGTVYDNQIDSVPAFRTLLRKAKNFYGLLPAWWSNEKTNECISYGAQTGHDFSLDTAQNISEVENQWNDPYMPMQLRMLGEKIYGVGPGSQELALSLSTMMSNGL